MPSPHHRPFPLHAALAAVFLFFAGAAAIRVALHETEVSHLIDSIAAKQDLNHVTNMDVNLNPARMGVFTSFFLRISQKEITSKQLAARNAQAVVDEMEELKAQVRASTGDSLVLCGLALAYLLLIDGIARRTDAVQAKIYSLLAVSLVFFAVGISCPVLTAVVKGEHVLIGGFIIETASKGIISTVVSLFHSGDWLISLLLAGFSIGIPIFKGIAVLVTSLSRSRARKAKMGRFLETIGKWSLTDVLVAAVLLGCFSLNAIRQPNGGVYAVPRIAFGFFVFYCAIAARTSYLLRRLGESGRPSEPPHPGSAILRAAALVLAAGAGIATGFAVPVDLPFGGNVAQGAIVRLVRTHTELLNRRFSASPERITEVPLDVPFPGTLSVQISAPSGRDVTLGLERIPTDAAGEPLDRPSVSVEGFSAVGGPKAAAQGKVPAGKYTLLVSLSGSGGLFSRDTFGARVSLDP